MSGYLYNELEPTKECPYCGEICFADFVDIGVGMTQCGPYHCDKCGASEIGPYDQERKLNKMETLTGWYKPNSEPGSSANVIKGKIVSYKQMESVYKKTFTGNPLYDMDDYVDNWWSEIRKP